MRSTIAFDSRVFRVALASAGYRSVAELAREAGISASYGRQIASGLLPGERLRERLGTLLATPVDDIWPPCADARRSSA
jgi:hypothetical protein